MQEAIATLLGQLVAFRTVEGQTEDKQRVSAFAASWLKDAGVTVTDYPHSENPSLLARTGGTGAPILFLAHLDVVPAPDHLFTMRRDGDRVFGRGVIDDKGPAAILMHLLAALARTENAPPVLLALTTDEEIGSSDGVERLVQNGIFDGVRAAIAIDGGEETKIVSREKGLLHFTLEATGKQAHGSMPWEGENAIDKILRCYQRIREVLPPIDDPSHWHATVNIGQIHGGAFVNQVAGSASAQIDIRFTDAHDLEVIQQLVESSLEDGVRITRASGGHPFETPADHPLLLAYQAAMKEALGKPVAIGSEHGATDGRFFRSMNIPIILHDPAGGGFHTEEEWLDLTSATRILDGLRTFVSQIMA